MQDTTGLGTKSPPDGLIDSSISPSSNHSNFALCGVDLRINLSGDFHAAYHTITDGATIEKMIKYWEFTWKTLREPSRRLPKETNKSLKVLKIAVDAIRNAVEDGID